MVHIGLKGIVRNTDKQPVKDAEVIVYEVEGRPMKTTERGEYWYLLLPGKYFVKAVADG